MRSVPAASRHLARAVRHPAAHHRSATADSPAGLARASSTPPKQLEAILPLRDRPSRGQRINSAVADTATRSAMPAIDPSFPAGPSAGPPRPGAPTTPNPPATRSEPGCSRRCGTRRVCQDEPHAFRPRESRSGRGSGPWSTTMTASPRRTRPKTRPASSTPITTRPAILALAGDVAGRRILDAGCGSGPLFAALRDRGAIVTGFDSSTEMLELARRRLGRRRGPAAGRPGQPAAVP